MKNKITYPYTLDYSEMEKILLQLGDSCHINYLKYDISYEEYEEINNSNAMEPREFAWLLKYSRDDFYLREFEIEGNCSMERFVALDPKHIALECGVANGIMKLPRSIDKLLFEDADIDWGEKDKPHNYYDPPCPQGYKVNILGRNVKREDVAYNCFANGEWEYQEGQEENMLQESYISKYDEGFFIEYVPLPFNMDIIK